MVVPSSQRSDFSTNYFQTRKTDNPRQYLRIHFTKCIAKSICFPSNYLFLGWRRCRIDDVSLLLRRIHDVSLLLRLGSRWNIIWGSIFDIFCSWNGLVLALLRTACKRNWRSRSIFPIFVHNLALYTINCWLYFVYISFAILMSTGKIVKYFHTFHTERRVVNTAHACTTYVRLQKLKKKRNSKIFYLWSSAVDGMLQYFYLNYNNLRKRIRI